MLKCFNIANPASCHETELTLSLPFEQRQKSRARAVTDNGREVGWFLEPGQALADGDHLRATDGAVIRIIAAEEKLSEAHCDDRHLLLRAAYHLGNRHVPLQIGLHSLRYQHDHVLDEMLRGLGLTVHTVMKPFQPEAGAYHSHGTHSHEH